MLLSLRILRGLCHLEGNWMTTLTLHVIHGGRESGRLIAESLEPKCEKSAGMEMSPTSDVVKLPLQVRG